MRTPVGHKTGKFFGYGDHQLEFSVRRGLVTWLVTHDRDSVGEPGLVTHFCQGPKLNSRWKPGRMNRIYCQINSRSGSSGHSGRGSSL
jgi:hypothetical protein